jgi:hypothetical protein
MSVGSLNYSHNKAYYSYPRLHTSMQSYGGLILTGETEEVREKPVPVPHCPPQITHGLTLQRTQASVVKSQWLTAWTMALPLFRIYLHYCTESRYVVWENFIFSTVIKDDPETHKASSENAFYCHTCNVSMENGSCIYTEIRGFDANDRDGPRWRYR